MTGTFLFLAALDCTGCSAGLAQLAHRARDEDPAIARQFGIVSLGLLVTGLGCLIWSKGA